MRHHATTGTSSEPRQFSLFEDAQSTAAIYTQAVNNLLERNLEDAAEHVADLVASRHAEAPLLDTILGMLRALQNPIGAIEAAALMDAISPMAQAMAGDHAETFMQGLWADLALRFPHEPLLEDRPQAHHGWMHLRSGNSHKAWEDLREVNLAQAPQWAIRVLAQAGYDSGGPSRGWAPLCWHAWRWPQDTPPLIRMISNTELREQHRAFEIENETELPQDWFPAWAATQNPDLAVLLRQSTQRHGAPIGSQAQQGAMDACDLVLAEIGGPIDMEKRQCLKESNDWVFRQYLKTR